MTFEVAPYFAAQQPVWLRNNPLGEVATNVGTQALMQAQGDKTEVLAGLAGTALSGAVSKDLRQIELNAFAEEKHRDRRNAIARMAGSLPQITPPSMYELTGLGGSQGSLGLVDANTRAYYELLRSGANANANTPALALPNS